jgi:hypothetical protein
MKAARAAATNDGGGACALGRMCDRHNGNSETGRHLTHWLQHSAHRGVDVAIDLRAEIAADRVDDDQLHVANLGNFLFEERKVNRQVERTPALFVMNGAHELHSLAIGTSRH